MPFTNSTAVPYGLLVMHAMDIYRLKTCPPAPFVAPSAPPGGGTIIGYVMGIDTLLLDHPQFTPGPLAGLLHDDGRAAGVHGRLAGLGPFPGASFLVHDGLPLLAL